ncbi:MAG: DUF3613 domain-containing protein [Pseudomonadota bacterium]
MIRSTLLASVVRSLVFLGVALPLLAHTALPAPGSQTEAWLELQRSGLQASSNPQAASAVQREKAAERFLKTYDFAIKESIYGDTFGAGK